MSNTLNNRLLRARLWEECGGKCSYCRKPMNPFLDFTIDHKIAVRNGGTDELSNLCAACRQCNRQKGAKDAPGSIFASMTPDEIEQHRMKIAQSTTMSSLNSRIRHANDVAKHLGIEVFQLTPGGYFRVWTRDVPRIEAYARAAQEDDDANG